jgi:SAM-dependent methyltransferase
MVVDAVIVVGLVTLYLFSAHFVSYELGKNRILKNQKWDLNICCGKTDGGGINADIVQHKELPGFRQVDDIYKLPFRNGEFESVLCSHTMEHVDDPERFYAELSRVGRKVTVVLPPLYDLAAVLSVMEHRWIFLTFRKEHHHLPKFVRLPFADALQRRFGQSNCA